MTGSPTLSRYGDDSSQFGELYRPVGPRRRGTVVIVHGGFWRARHDLSLGRPLAADLAARGYTAWNLEYRRVGAGGGWPATLEDIAAGIDHLADLDVDLSCVLAVGHSAGGHLAVWVAGRDVRSADTPGAGPVVRLSGVVAQAGVLDLAGGATGNVGNGAIVDLLGGTPQDVPDRYRVADPMRAIPLHVPVACLHSRRDVDVPFQQSAAYVAAARAAGADVSLVETSGDHFTMIDPGHADWAVVHELLMSF
ncbi:MAG TPA: alpha/beta hydrolase [Jatrophihabitantaceae bacterium]